MAWIESNQELGRHPKTKKLARLLGISVVTAVGHLHFLWWWALDFAQDGILDKYDECDIADACLWEGDAKSLIDALVKSKFIDETADGLFIHDWFEYAGKLIAQRNIKKEQTSERVKRYREKVGKKRNGDVTRYKNVCNAGATQSNAPTVPYTTVPNSTVPNNNNNNAREENEQIVNESTESVTNPDETANEEHDPANDLAKTVPGPEKNRPRDLGTQAVNWAEKNWGIPIPEGNVNSILAWCDELLTRGSPDPDALVIEALKHCLDANARNMNYLRAVLSDWRDNGILAVTQVEAREVERKSQKGHKRGNKDPGEKPPRPSSGKYDDFYL